MSLVTTGEAGNITHTLRHALFLRHAQLLFIRPALIPPSLPTGVNFSPPDFPALSQPPLHESLMAAAPRTIATPDATQ